jgi:hypothetical protein
MFQTYTIARNDATDLLGAIQSRRRRLRENASIARPAPTMLQPLPLLPQKRKLDCSAISVAVGHVWTVPALQGQI